MNTLLGTLGLSSWEQDWLGDPDLALWSVIGVIVWQFAGYSMVIFLILLAYGIFQNRATRATEAIGE